MSILARSAKLGPYLPERKNGFPGSDATLTLIAGWMSGSAERNTPGTAAGWKADGIPARSTSAGRMMPPALLTRSQIWNLLMERSRLGIHRRICRLAGLRRICPCAISTTRPGQSTPCGSCLRRSRCSMWPATLSRARSIPTAWRRSSATPPMVRWKSLALAGACLPRHLF